ncbi:MAG TPA: hypothetical protein VGI39_27805 [Polyangiaceae bacterium]|jgi:hypothetical protein
MGRPKLIGARVRSAAFALAVLPALLAAPTLAHAQSAEDKAAAQVAFEEGKHLMAAQAYAEACSKFSESLHRDPGLGAMLGLADCYEKNGQTASAWAEFLEAAGAAARKGDRREALARENATRLEPLLSRVVVRVPPKADVRGLAVKRDGVEIGRALWGEAVPVDPGVHAVSASAPGTKDWQTSIEVPARSGAQTVTVPRLESAPVAAAAPAPATAPPPGSAAHPAELSATDRGRTQRLVGLGVAGVGVVGVVVGAIFGLDAKSKLDDSNGAGHCDASDACDGYGLQRRSDAKSAALASTVSFVVGGVALAGGAALWFTAPKRGTARVGLTPSPAGTGVGIVGVW